MAYYNISFDVSRTEQNGKLMSNVWQHRFPRKIFTIFRRLNFRQTKFDEFDIQPDTNAVNFHNGRAF